MKKPTIVTKNLTKKFGKLAAVQDLNLEIKAGEIFGFLGPNGAGKSTTIRMLMGFIFPTSGEVSVLGVDPRRQHVELMNKVGYIAGDIALYENYTVAAHLNYLENVRGRKSTAATKKLKTDLLERFDLDPKRKIKNLSKGNKQKVAIVQAFMHRPQLLILDEPTSGLDPLLQVEFYNLLHELKEEGSTIFLSSHVLSEIQKVCDRAGIIRNGELIAMDTLKSLGILNHADNTSNVYHIELITSAKFTQASLSLPKDAITKLDQKSTTAEFDYTGDINSLIAALSKLKLQHVRINESSLNQQSLEDLFLNYYKSSEQ